MDEGLGLSRTPLDEKGYDFSVSLKCKLVALDKEGRRGVSGPGMRAAFDGSYTQSKSPQK